MSVNTPTARKHLRERRAPRVSTYPKYTRPGFPANTPRSDRKVPSVQRRENARVLRKAQGSLKKYATPAQYGKPRRGRWKPGVYKSPTPEFRKTTIPAHDRLRREIRRNLLPGLRRNPGVDLALEAVGQIYNRIETTTENAPKFSWLTTVARNGADTGWNYASTLEASVPPYASYAGLPNQELGSEWETTFIADTFTGKAWLYKRNGYYFGVPRYSKPGPDDWVTGQPEWPFGTQEVETVVPRPLSSPAPFPNVRGRPRYRPLQRPKQSVKTRRDPRFAPKAAKAANPTGIEMGVDKFGRLYAKYRVKSGGRDKFERKSTAERAFKVLANILDSVSEVKDFYEILQEAVDMPSGLGPLEQLQWVADNLENIDWVDFAIDLGLNEIEDQVAGRIHGATRQFDVYGLRGRVNLI